jgi:hypothetical protein
MYSFSNLSDLLEAIEGLKSETEIYYIRFSDYFMELDKENRTKSFQLNNYQSNEKLYLYLIYKLNEKRNFREELKSKLENYNGQFVSHFDEKDRKKYLNEITNFELNKKKASSVLMLQHFLIKKGNLTNLVNNFLDLAKKYNIQVNYFCQMDANDSVRLVCLCLTDNKDWIHFLASKAILHEVMKKNYALGGKAYSYGLLNTMYFLRYEKQAKIDYSKRKHREDEFDIMNPNKIVRSKMTLSRINLMFSFALLFRSKQIKKKRA